MTEDTRFGRFAEVCFWLLLIAYVWFLLSLSAFPAEDAPVHLYYADVMKELMTGGHSYGQYFEIRHWLPPYALIYYFFIALDSFVSPLLADRLLLCLYTVLMACGFRYLVRVLNPSSAAMAVLIFPFIFNKFVYLGFYNFVFATALTLILCAYWLRDPLRLRGWRRYGFLALVVLVLLSHPVPLLVAFMVMGAHLVALIVTAAGKSSGTSPGKKRLWVAVREFSPAILSLFMACLTSAYVLLFVTGGGGSKFSTMAESLVKVRKLIMFGPISPFQVWYYALPLGLLVAGIGLPVLVFAFRRRLAWSLPQVVLLGVGIFCALLYLVAPDLFSGGSYFDQRFPIFALLFILAAFASSATFEHGPFRVAIAVFALAVSVGGLVYQVEFCRAYQLAADLYRMPVVKAGTKGAIVMDDASIYLPPGLAFGPYRWVGAHYFRHSKAILLNSPFLYTGTMPLKIAPSALTSLNPLGSEINPMSMGRVLLSDHPANEVDFVVFVGDSEHLSADSMLSRLCERNGFVKAWSTGSVSMYTRPASTANAETMTGH
jgi:hypothetical protein